MKNGWTGGQYSLYRIVLAMYLLYHFLPSLLRGAERSSPLSTILLSLGIVLSALLGLGLYDRAAALGLLCIGVCLLASDALHFNPSVLCIGLLLLAHLLLPPAPYGSWAARGRIDPGGNWRMPPMIFAAAWIVLALGYTYSGCTKLISHSWRDGSAMALPGSLPAWFMHLATWGVLALELSYAPLALLPRLRPWLWGLMLLVLLLGGIDFTDLRLGMLLLQLFTFDPGWIRPLSGKTERIFYDGHCGLCQRSVRLILAEDASGTAFRFAPLQGETFASSIAEKQREALPMSMVVQTANGTLLTRSAGVLHILRRLGGIWRLLAGVLALIPTMLRDRLYDGVARIRHRIFARPEEVCPLMPPQLRERFDP